VFIGPPVAAIQTMGDKIAAKAAVPAFGVPVVPGVSRPGLTDADLIAGAEEVGYPVLVKPSAGGGGKGMRVVHQPAELPAALASARREAASAFGDDTLFLERFVLNPRHIEVQVLADGYGNVVHLGERECSLQRRHQKVIEEAPSPLLDPATRARIGAAACDTARSVDYTGAGTVEFIVSADRPDEFFFMEMNTRLQVEHPVTEMVTGIDLVEQQVRIAAGEKLPIGQDDITMWGHAIEARVYAEDPARGFLPTGGEVVDLAEPDGRSVRVDSGLAPGMVIGSEYDPMLAKVIAHGDDRASALRALDRALADTAVLGVTTNIEFLRFLLADPDVVAGPAGHRTARSPHPGLRSGATRRRRADRRGRIQVAARVAHAGRRFVGGAVGLANGGAGTDDVPAARGRAHRPRVPHRPAGRSHRAGRGRRNAFAESISRRRSADRHARRPAHRVPRCRHRSPDLAVGRRAHRDGRGSS
jgi:acetyl-CoA/propionyl-CoA carboxylase, biotin carboxylase, biotin carboxyl carrier protein